MLSEKGLTCFDKLSTNGRRVVMTISAPFTPSSDWCREFLSDLSRTGAGMVITHLS
jgi:hypothetical protein